MTDCGTCRELLGGYVLGGLGPEDMALVERHIEGCPRCGREYGELASLPALLDLAGSADEKPESPPAELEEAVLDRFARERRGVAARASRPRRGLQVGLALAGAALAAAVAIVVTGAFSSSTDDAFGHAHLTGGRASADAELTAVREGTRVELSVRGPAPGMYELWCITEKGRWLSGGTFRVDASGRADVRLTSAARPGDYHRVLVTRGKADERGVVMAGRVEY